MSHVLSAEGLTSGLYLQDLRTTLNRAAPKESRGGPINYSDADSGDLVPAVTLSTREWAAHRRRPSICPPWLGVTTMSQVIQNSPAKHLWTDMGCNAPLSGLKSQVRQHVPGPSVGTPWTAADPGKRTKSASGAEGRRFESCRGHTAGGTI